MADISPELRELLIRTKLSVLPEDYLVIHLPLDSKVIPGEWYRPATTRFAVFVRGAKEISLIVTRRKWLRMQSIFDRYQVSGPMKVIALDCRSSAAVAGFAAAIGSMLAQSGIHSLPVSTQSSDHVVVQKGDLPRCIRTLHKCFQAPRPHAKS
jgi:hypothetical protein